MSSIHIGAEKEDIAPIVLMPGDPNRALFIASKFLENAKLVNKVRGELAYTGTYKEKKVTVFSSGMGIGSMGIYSHELFDYYDVSVIIRIGTCGSYDKLIENHSLFISTSSYSTTDFDEETGYKDEKIINSSSELNDIIEKTALVKGLKTITGRVHTTDAFYGRNTNYDKLINIGCKVTDMETYSLLYNAKVFHKKATSLLTVTDNLITGERLSTEEREKNVNDMILLALDSIIKC